MGAVVRRLHNVGEAWQFWSISAEEGRSQPLPGGAVATWVDSELGVSQGLSVREPWYVTDTGQSTPTRKDSAR